MFIVCTQTINITNIIRLDICAGKCIRAINLPRNMNVNISQKQYFHTKSSLPSRRFMHPDTSSWFLSGQSVTRLHEYVIRYQRSTGRDDRWHLYFRLTAITCCTLYVPCRHVGRAIIRVRKAMPCFTTFLT